MDLLVVVGSDQPPERLALRAHHILKVPLAEVTPTLIAEIRARIPRHVAVFGVGAATVATKLCKAGLPTELHTDEDVSDLSDLIGVEVVPLTDPGPKMEVADSLLDLVGNTPMVRLDRIGRDLPCPLVAKLEILNPGGSVKDRPAAAHDRGGRTRGAAAARLDDRRGHFGQHGRRARDRRRPASLPLRVRDARQDGPREGRSAPCLWRGGDPVPDRGRAGPPGVVLLGDGAPFRGDPRRLPP